MSRLAALALVGLLFAGCAAPGDVPGTSSSEPWSLPENSPPPPSKQSGAQPSPTPGLLKFRLNESYPVGSNVSVVLENGDRVSYRYRTYYAACDLGYYNNATNRKFLIPEGTHCDIANEAELKPGESKSLFVWRGLKECVKDDWGCTESRTLPAGTYRIHGYFETWGSGRGGNATSGASASVIFRIV